MVVWCGGHDPRLRFGLVLTHTTSVSRPVVFTPIPQRGPIVRAMLATTINLTATLVLATSVLLDNMLTRPDHPLQITKTFIQFT
jgi:hypothetical protein